MAYLCVNNARLVRWPGPAASPASYRLGCVQGFLFRLFEALGAWQDRATGRRQLARLDDRMLQDVGLDRASAQSETSKWFWQE